jgi:hypothetical protein
MGKVRPVLLWPMICALALPPALGAAQQSETLGSVKQKYLSQKVVLIGYVSDNLASQPVLMEWHPGTEVAGRYNTDIESYLPATFKGQTATVIAIQLNGLQKQGKVNALGESISPDSIVHPYFDFVVRLGNGEIAIATGYPTTISEDVKLASEQNAIIQEMAVKLPSVVGKNLFACGFTSLYSPDATLEDLLGSSAIVKRISNVPFLVPLRVTVAKYDQTANAVILKVKLPDGREALAIASGDQLTIKDESFMERISGFLLPEVPKTLTPQEIAAIKKQSIFRGMSENALFYLMGLPKSKNDWGRGGRQFIYTDSLMVYLNNQHKVVDWQSLDNK